MDHVVAQEPAEVGLIVNDVAHTAEFGVAAALIENVTHARVGQIYPGDHAEDRCGLPGQVQQPPGFIQDGVGLDDN